MSKHTPGPWIATDAHQVITDWLKVGFLTSVADCRIGGGGTEEWTANARLIAAAPELLGSLKSLLAGSEKHIFSTECKTERDAARAAIAKAEGRA